MKDQCITHSILDSEYIQILLTFIKSSSVVIRKYSFLILSLLTFYRQHFSDLLKLISSPIMNSLVFYIFMKKEFYIDKKTETL